MPKPETKSNAKSKSTKIDAQATLKKLQAKDPGLKKLLEKAYGYAVFPAVGKANLVVGGALGRGEVFEKGKKVGYATITQLLIGVQIGGDTFDEVVVFESRETFERFKRGKTAFAANASAVLVKAGAASAKNFESGAAVYVYPHGGMMLELGIGGQRFKFKPADEEQDEGKQKGGEQAGQHSGKSSGKGKGKGAQGRGQEDEGEEEGQDEGEEGDEAGEGEEGDEEASSSSGGNRALELAGRAVGGVRSAAAKATEMVKRHPVAATVAGVGVLAGLSLLVSRATSGDAAEEGEEEDQDSGGEEEEQDEGARDSAEDSDEDESGEDEDRDDEDEDTDARAEDEGGEEDDEGEDEGSEEDESEDRGVLSRLLSRGKSRP